MARVPWVENVAREIGNDDLKRQCGLLIHFANKVALLQVFAVVIFYTCGKAHLLFPFV